ncbi:phage head spike fiber domain-containing protein, partial [Roseospira marina]
GVVQPAATFSRASSAILWDGAAFQAVGPDVPRIEAGALLIESAATNTAYQSTDMAVFASSSRLFTRLESAGVGSWARLTAATDGTAQLIAGADAMTVGATYTFSCYARAGTRDQIFLQGREHRYPKTNFDVTSGTIISEASEYTSVITPLTGGAYRCAITFVADATTPYILALGFAALAGESADFYGRQVERGPRATSLIATGDGAATRAADVLTFTPATTGTASLIGTAADGTAYPAGAPHIVGVSPGVPWTAPPGRWSDVWVMEAAVQAGNLE